MTLQDRVDGYIDACGPELEAMSDGDLLSHLQALMSEAQMVKAEIRAARAILNRRTGTAVVVPEYDVPF